MDPKKDRNWDLRDMGNPDPPEMLDWSVEEYVSMIEESERNADS